MNTAAATERHACDCKACNGAAFTCPTGYLGTTTPTQYRDMVHNYTAYANGAPAMARVFARKGIVKA